MPRVFIPVEPVNHGSIWPTVAAGVLFLLVLLAIFVLVWRENVQYRRATRALEEYLMARAQFLRAVYAYRGEAEPAMEIREEIARMHRLAQAAWTALSAAQRYRPLLEADDHFVWQSLWVRSKAVLFGVV